MKIIIKKLVKKIKNTWYSFRVKKVAAKVGKKLIVNAKSTVNSQTYLGSNVNFNGIKIHGCGKVIIGDNFHSGSDCLVLTEVHNYDTGTKIPYDETFICKDVVISDNVWIGTRVIILGGVSIGEGVIIQAGSVITSSIPNYSIAGGHPAKVFKTRNIQHYENLKAKNKFY
jgi:acetyltransferase-like isoleucine patch superfamily enzyme